MNQEDVGARPTGHPNFNRRMIVAKYSNSGSKGGKGVKNLSGKSNPRACSAEKSPRSKGYGSSAKGNNTRIGGVYK